MCVCVCVCETDFEDTYLQQFRFSYESPVFIKPFERPLTVRFWCMQTVWALSLGETCEGRTSNVRLWLESRVLVISGIQVGRHLFDSQYIRIYSLKRSVEGRCYVRPNSIHLMPVIFSVTA